MAYQCRCWYFSVFQAFDCPRTEIALYNLEHPMRIRECGKHNDTQPAVTCSKLTVETLEQGVKYIQS